MAIESGGILKGFSFSKIVSGVNSTLNFVNRAIPIYKQVTPIVKNVKSVFNTTSSIKKATKEAEIEEKKAFQRPISPYKKEINNNDRGKINLDTLTFFQ